MAIKILPNALTLNGVPVIGVGSTQYVLATGIDTGQILPDTTTLSSLLFDGDIVSGDRTGNRTWNLTILVFAVNPTRADLSAQINALLAALNVDSFPVVWTPGGCPSSTVMTRGRPTLTVQKSLIVNDSLAAQVAVSFQTGPFMASTGVQTITVPASGGPAQLQVDGMNTSPFTNGTLNTSTKFEGAGSCAFTMTRSAPFPSTTVYTSRIVGRALSGDDLSSYASASVRLNLENLAIPVGVTVTLRLTDGGATYLFPFTYSAVAVNAAWILCTFDLMSVSPSLLTAVTQWGIELSTTQYPAIAAGSFTAFIDDLRAYPPGSVGNSTAEGGVLTIPSIMGSARTPVALEVDRAGSTFTNLLVHSPPAGQDPDLTILAGLSGGSVTVPNANMHYKDTFSAVALCTASGSGTRTVTVTFTQKQGSTTVATATLTQVVTGTAPPILNFGDMTLPLLAVPPENSGCSLIIAITSTGGSADTWSDVALCSTSGQTILLTGLGAAVACEAVYVDPPSPLVGVGNIYQAGSLSRVAAMFISGLIGGGPLIVEPGNNKLLVASAAGAPGVTVTYTPQWLDEAQV